MWEPHFAYCLNGHQVGFLPIPGDGLEMFQNSQHLSSADWHPDYCTTCGEKTLDACPDCGRRFTEESPNYCGGCGKVFPWTESRLAAARELAEAAADLTQEQRHELSSLIPQLAIITPRLELAIFRAKPLLQKLGPVAKDVMVKSLVSIASEETMRGLGLKQ